MFTCMYAYSILPLLLLYCYLCQSRYHSYYIKLSFYQVVCLTHIWVISPGWETVSISTKQHICDLLSFSPSLYFSWKFRNVIEGIESFKMTSNLTLSNRNYLLKNMQTQWCHELFYRGMLWHENSLKSIN